MQLDAAQAGCPGSEPGARFHRRAATDRIVASVRRKAQRGDRAVLVVEGVGRDDLKLRGRVLMAKGEGGWRQEQSDLDSVE